jgi:excisionase family DNA binding protein
MRTPYSHGRRVATPSDLTGHTTTLILIDDHTRREIGVMATPRLCVKEILAKPTMSVPEYAQVTGISRDHAYALAARDELGVRILRLGRSMRIPTADVRRLLGEGSEAVA